MKTYFLYINFVDQSKITRLKRDYGDYIKCRYNNFSEIAKRKTTKKIANI